MTVWVVCDTYDVANSRVTGPVTVFLHRSAAVKYIASLIEDDDTLAWQRAARNIENLEEDGVYMGRYSVTEYDVLEGA